MTQDIFLTTQEEAARRKAGGMPVARLTAQKGAKLVKLILSDGMLLVAK